MTSKLKEARLKAGYSIEDISLKLNIRKQYLIGLEEEDYEAIPGKIYVEGYTKLYAEFLGVERPILPGNNTTKILKKTQSRIKAKLKSKFSQKYLILSSMALLVMLFITYNYIKYRNNPSNHGSDIDFSSNYTNTENNSDINAIVMINDMIGSSTIKNLNNILENDDESYDTEFIEGN